MQKMPHSLGLYTQRAFLQLQNWKWSQSQPQVSPLLPSLTQPLKEAKLRALRLWCCDNPRLRSTALRNWPKKSKGAEYYGQGQDDAYTGSAFWSSTSPDVRQFLKKPQFPWILLALDFSTNSQDEPSSVLVSNKSLCAHWSWLFF